MTATGDLPYEMNRWPLDLDTADRLLSGSVPPEDAPPGYSDVARFFAALAPENVELASEAQIVPRLTAVVRSSQLMTTRQPGRSLVPRLKLAAAVATVALAGTASLAVAGSLPGAAQDVASTMLLKVGVSVPGPNANAGDHPNVRGQSSSDAAVTRVETDASSGKGSAISELATTTDLTGVEKGAAISTLASGGKSQAGQHGQAASAHGAPVATPNGGGTGTADTASGGQSSAGTAIANTASDGHSAAGSGNAAGGQSHRP